MHSITKYAFMLFKAKTILRTIMYVCLRKIYFLPLFCCLVFTALLILIIVFVYA